VNESSESTGGPNERLEAVSASNRFNFELQTEYNAAVPVDRKAGKKHEEEKPSADGKRANPSAPPPHPAQAPASSGRKLILPPNPGPGGLKPTPQRSLNAKPKPGGQR
jgi:hypothetical protein